MCKAIYKARASLTLFGQLIWRGTHSMGSLVTSLHGVPVDTPPKPELLCFRHRARKHFTDTPTLNPTSRCTTENTGAKRGRAAWPGRSEKAEEPDREPGLGSSKACAPPSETILWDIDGLSQSALGTSEGRPRHLGPRCGSRLGVAPEVHGRSIAQIKGHSPSTDAQVTVQRRKRRLGSAAPVGGSLVAPQVRSKVDPR